MWCLMLKDFISYMSRVYKLDKLDSVALKFKYRAKQKYLPVAKSLIQCIYSSYEHPMITKIVPVSCLYNLN